MVRIASALILPAMTIVSQAIDLIGECNKSDPRMTREAAAQKLYQAHRLIYEAGKLLNS